MSLGEENGGPFFPDHLDDIRLLPLVLLADCLVAGSAELDADRIRFFRLDDLLHQIDAVPRDVGRPDQNDLPALDGYAVDVFVFQEVPFLLAC